MAREKPQKPTVLHRKSPSQSRARQTVDAIFEATARILLRDGEQQLNTNRIADIAGFSIGTLYQYFPNKDAILLAMTEREIRRTAESMQTLIRQTTPQQSPEEIIRQIVRLLLKAFSGRHKIRRLIIFHIMRSPSAAAKLQAIGNLNDFLKDLVANAPAGIRALSEPELFVISRAVLGAVRAAVMEESPLLNAQYFEDALVRLIIGYIQE